MLRIAGVRVPRVRPFGFLKPEGYGLLTGLRPGLAGRFVVSTGTPSRRRVCRRCAPAGARNTTNAEPAGPSWTSGRSRRPLWHCRQTGAPGWREKSCTGGGYHYRAQLSGFTRCWRDGNKVRVEKCYWCFHHQRRSAFLILLWSPSLSLPGRFGLIVA